jgi:ABC-type uncharacterized transport system permease subunit
VRDSCELVCMHVCKYVCMSNVVCIWKVVVVIWFNGTLGCKNVSLSRNEWLVSEMGLFTATESIMYIQRQQVSLLLTYILSTQSLIAFVTQQLVCQCRSSRFN